MAYTIEINSVDKTSLLKAGSLNVTRRTEHNNSCSLTITTTAAGYMPYEGQDLKVKSGGTVIFGGVIWTIKPVKAEGGYGSSKTVELEITSDGYRTIPARRTINVTADSANKSAGEIVLGFLSTALLGWEGITSGVISSGASTFNEYDSYCRNIGMVLDDMAKLSAYKWYIDDNKALHFVADEAEVNAAHDIVEGGAFTDYKVEDYEISLDGYANRVFMRILDDDGYEKNVSAQDDTEAAARAAIEGGSGVYGTVIDNSDVETLADAQVMVDNTLKKTGIIPRTLQISSFTLDWQPATKLKVNLPTLGISSDTYFLIEEVTIRDLTNQILQCNFTATVRKSDSFTTQGNQTGIDYLKGAFGSNSGGDTNMVMSSTGGVYQTNLYVDVDWPAGAKAKSVLAETDNPTIDDGLASTGLTLTWASEKQLKLTGDFILPDPASAKNMTTSTADHEGVVMFCVRNGSSEIITGTINSTVAFADNSTAQYVWPDDTIVVRTGITQTWEVLSNGM